MSKIAEITSPLLNENSRLCKFRGSSFESFEVGGTDFPAAKFARALWKYPSYRYMYKEAISDFIIFLVDSCSSYYVPTYNLSGTNASFSIDEDQEMSSTNLIYSIDQLDKEIHLILKAEFDTYKHLLSENDIDLAYGIALDSILKVSQVLNAFGIKISKENFEIEITEGSGFIMSYFPSNNKSLYIERSLIFDKEQTHQSFFAYYEDKICQLNGYGDFNNVLVDLKNLIPAIAHNESLSV